MPRILSYNSRFIITWDFVLVLSILVSSVTIPYRMTFGIWNADALYWLFTILFIVDIFIQLNTEMRKGVSIISDRRQIATAYVR